MVKLWTLPHCLLNPQGMLHNTLKVKKSQKHFFQKTPEKYPHLSTAQVCKKWSNKKTLNYVKLEIKPCGLGSRIRDMEAELISFLESVVSRTGAVGWAKLWSVRQDMMCLASNIRGQKWWLPVKYKTAPTILIFKFFLC